MRGKQVNPYHSVGIYDNDTEASLQGFLYSPTRVLPSMQFFNSDNDTVASWQLIEVSTGATYNQDPSQWSSKPTLSGPTFYTYFGDVLSSPPADGTYRARIVMTKTAKVYWSHAICCTRLFDTAAQIGAGIELTLDDCEQTNGYDLDFTMSGASWVEIYLSAALIDTVAPVFTLSASAFPNETRTYTIIGYAEIEDSNGGSINIHREFEVVLDSDDACGTIVITPGAVSGDQGEELGYLEWWNKKDIQAQGILYQDQVAGSYRQRLYGKFWRDAPTPVLEPTFLVAANGSRVLQSATTAEQLNLECWPVPDYAFTVLQNAGLHENVTFSNLDGTTTELDQFDFQSAAFGESDMYNGIFQCRINQTYVSGCREDYEEDPEE